MNDEYTIIIPVSVKQDIEEIILCYYHDRKEYSHKLYNHITSRIQTLKHFPEKGRIVVELEKNSIIGIREIIESYYRIMYRIEKKDAIILTVIDGRRNVEDILVKKLKRSVISGD